jgi:Transglutaminase-like superfamily
VPRLISDLSKAIGIGPRGWADLARAVLELALANRRMAMHTMRELLGSAQDGDRDGAGQALSEHHIRLIARVAHAVPIMGLRVPWRSDCLVQALAARRWLASEGIASDLCIGVRVPGEADFAAHAWLKVGDTVVTGGDIAGYEPLLAPEDALPASLAGMR